VRSRLECQEWDARGGDGGVGRGRGHRVGIETTVSLVG
jgi:hypothetical protein